VIESFEIPIVRTYRIVVVYNSFCISSKAAGVSSEILFPNPDSTANDPAIVPPIASSCISFSLLRADRYSLSTLKASVTVLERTKCTYSCSQYQKIIYSARAPCGKADT
jgi:hypothetical protein